MYKKKGPWASNVGTPHALTVSLTLGTIFFTKLFNPRTTLRSSGFSFCAYGLFDFFSPRGLALMLIPPAVETIGPGANSGGRECETSAMLACFKTARKPRGGKLLLRRGKEKM